MSDSAIEDRVSAPERTNGVAPTPVSATVSPVWTHERGGARQREAGCRMLDRDVRGARARRRDRDDDVRHELLRAERGHERAEQSFRERELPLTARASEAGAAHRARAGLPACPTPGRRGRRCLRSSRGFGPADRRSRRRIRRWRREPGDRGHPSDMSSTQVVSGPMCSSPSRSSTPRSASREMSTTSDGRAIRSFITGTSDCPPAIAFASGSASSSSAWSRSDARA